MSSTDFNHSAVQNIHDTRFTVKARKALNFFNDKNIPLLENAEIKKSNSNTNSNSLKYIDNKLDIENSPTKMEAKRKSGKKRSNGEIPKIFSKINNNILDNLQNKIDTARNILEASKPGEQSFGRMRGRHEELKDATEKSRQAFSAYKLSTFFCFDSEFLKAYGDGLSKVETALKSMEAALERAQQKQSPANYPIDIENVMSESIISSDEELNKMEKPDPGSLTPPASEVESNEKSIPEGSGSFSQKRKADLTEENPRPKRENRSRRYGANALAPPANTSSLHSLFTKSQKEDIEMNDNSDSDSDIKEAEYEVRKIRDYLKKQSGYHYKVSWHGYSSDEDTYEPADHLDGCDDVLTEFFYERLKEREHISEPEQLKSLLLPSDERVKDLLYSAFEKLQLPLSKKMRESGIKIVTSTKPPVLKTREEVQDDIIKFLSLRDPSQERYKKVYNSIIEQVAYKELYLEREKQLADLRSWERSMNIISSDLAPLTVENNIDLELPPLDFVYVNEYVPSANITIPSDPMAGCQCKECNPLQKGCCASEMGSYYAYNKYGRLRVSLGTPIYECNKACKCPPDCSNRVVQKGRTVSLSIFRTANGRGWGVKTLEPIKKDQFVSEYVGEVITSEEAEQRGMKYDTKGCTYLFDLDYNKGDQNPYTVDAVKYGNVSHFINHSCDPNLVVFNVWVNCLDPDLPKLALFAARDVKKGEEITFDYNSGSTKQISIIDKIDGKEGSFPLSPKKCLNEEGSSIIPTTEFIRKTPRQRVLNAGKTECKCGAANCRKFFF